MKIISTSALIVATLLATSNTFASTTIDVVGAQQGTIYAGSPSVIDENSAADFVQIARDVDSGMPTGKRMHRPMHYRTTWDMSKNKAVRTAMATGENLDVVVHDADCSTGVCISVHLTGCTITDVRDVRPPRGSASKVVYSDITITFQKIEILK